MDSLQSVCGSLDLILVVEIVMYVYYIQFLVQLIPEKNLFRRKQSNFKKNTFDALIQLGKYIPKQRSTPSKDIKMIKNGLDNDTILVDNVNIVDCIPHTQPVPRVTHENNRNGESQQHGTCGTSMHDDTSLYENNIIETLNELPTKIGSTSVSVDIYRRETNTLKEGQRLSYDCD